MTAHLQRLVIIGDQWARGDYKLSAMRYLIGNADGNCCIGIHGLALGITPQAFVGARMPYNIKADTPAKLHFVELWERPLDGLDDPEDSPVEANVIAASINDGYSSTDAERIAKLEPVFNALGYTLVYCATGEELLDLWEAERLL